MKNNNSGTISLSLSGCGFVCFIVFLILKLLNVIDWNWFWVWFPLWSPIALYLVIFAIIFIVIAIKER